MDKTAPTIASVSTLVVTAAAGYFGVAAPAAEQRDACQEANSSCDVMFNACVEERDTLLRTWEDERKELMRLCTEGNELRTGDCYRERDRLLDKLLGERD